MKRCDMVIFGFVIFDQGNIGFFFYQFLICEKLTGGPSMQQKQQWKIAFKRYNLIVPIFKKLTATYFKEFFTLTHFWK